VQLQLPVCCARCGAKLPPVAERVSAYEGSRTLGCRGCNASMPTSPRDPRVPQTPAALPGRPPAA
jgi:ribosomal protein L40E